MKDDILSGVTIEDAAAEGKCIVRHEGKVIFVKYAVPGDIADIRITFEKKKYAEAEIIHLHQRSPLRADIRCQHFGVCGGCAWQQLVYSEQIKQKEQQVIDALERLGKVNYTNRYPILGCNTQYYYRNKLDFSFSNKRWLLASEKNEPGKQMDALGFHVPGRFDKVLDIQTCHLQDDRSNKIRNFVREFTITQGYPFYDLRQHEGMMRNLIVRNTSLDEWMVIVVFARDNKDQIEALLDALHKEFPFITSLLYAVNEKKNDSIYDLDIKVYKGNDFILEKLGDLKFRIRPKSFFQTNSEQAYELYKITLAYAGLTGDQLVYDLYTGTGTIANFVASKSKHVVGIESVPQAIEDAKENSKLNGITNTSFLVGDMKDVFNEEIIRNYGSPEVVITDPPRAGMHEKVVRNLLHALPKKIVYVSCNPSTQARDLALLQEKYTIEKVQPVDMFPHTHHVENVTQLILK